MYIAEELMEIYNFKSVFTVRNKEFKKLSEANIGYADDSQIKNNPMKNFQFYSLNKERTNLYPKSIF